MEFKEIIYNRGIGGFTTADMLQCMDEQNFLESNLPRFFINIGTNDISDPNTDFDILLKEMLKNYEEILGQIKDKLPKTSVYTMAFYPVK